MEPIKFHSSIPKSLRNAANKLSDRIKEVDYEGIEDGFWVYTREGWHDGLNPGCHCVHEWNVKDTIRNIKYIEPEINPNKTY